MAINCLLTRDNFDYIMHLLEKNPDAVTRLGSALWSYHERHPNSSALGVLTFIHEYGTEDILDLFARDVVRRPQPKKVTFNWIRRKACKRRRPPLFFNIDIHFHITGSGKIDFNADEIITAIDRIGEMIEDRFGTLEADPSLGNVYQTVNKYYISTPLEHQKKEDEELPAIDRDKIREEIIEYVNRLRCYVAQSRQDTYELLWRSILSLHELEDLIYRSGKQKNVSFNRYLVANIICIMKRKGVIFETNDTLLSKALKCNDSVRKQLNIEPNRDIKEAVIELLKRQI
jgi:hypothetical protein